ncbi:MAG: metallophosphoesterase [Planctomycetia bacterium]|nr:metallophosphoesterase [Planctomycetia bacterium]
MTRKLIHISDIHFGRVDQATVEPLIRAAHEVRPDVIVVSGDLTQRAHASEFREARRFLDALPKPQLIVPGNHDVPFYNIAARFLTPLANYRKYIDTELEARYEDSELIIQGINTARSLTWKNGRINERQIDLMRRSFCGAPSTTTKILVTHHPLDLPRRFDDDDIVGRARPAMEALAECGVDLLLAGHYHIAHTGDTRARYPIENFSALVVQAATTTSSRVREEPNSFNLLRIEPAEITIDRYTWRPAEGIFASFLTEQFHRTEQGWTRRESRQPEGRDVVIE